MLEHLDAVVQRVELLEDRIGLEEVFGVEVSLVLSEDDFFLEDELRGFSDHIQQRDEVGFFDFYHSILVLEQLLQCFVADSILVVVFEVCVVVYQDAQCFQFLDDLPCVSLFRVHFAGFLVQSFVHPFLI